MFRQDAIKQLLENSIHPFAKFWELNLETQVNVIASDKRIEGEFKGRRWNGYEYPDGEIAKPFRIPWKAYSDPEYKDTTINHSIDKIEAIGCTGWNWFNRESKWFGYDFDSIIGHKSGLEDNELEEIKEKIKKIDWISIISSKSGKGFHLYILLNKGIKTANHHEHAALARSILSLISIELNYDIKTKVDVCGGNLWIYHKETKENGFKLIKEGTEFNTDWIPPNWKSQEDVVKGKSSRTLIDTNIDEINSTLFTPLDEHHKKVLNYLKESKAFWWWDHDRHMLVCHTHDLKKAKEHLKLIGLYDTASEGKDSFDQNCFAFPTFNGGWTIRRHTKGAKETQIWEDINGWTTTTLNVAPDLHTVARLSGGSQDEKGNYVFDKYTKAINSLKLLNLEIPNIPEQYTGVLRAAKIIKIKGKGILLNIECVAEPTPVPEGYIYERKKLKLIINSDINDNHNRLFTSIDNFARHLVCQNKDAGWCIKTDKGWITETKENTSSFLLAKGIKDIPMALGQLVENPWEIVTLPFSPEYPGNREWNKNAAKFSCIPEPGEYPTFNLILDHIGQSLNQSVIENSWCKENGITTGAEYLKCWIASMFQFPDQPLPYLFLFGDEDTGKSLLHEMISVLFKNGYVRADNALTNPQGFNGELLGAVLCYIEETNLQTSKVAAQRIKDFVTSRSLSIHIKGQTPFDLKNNTTHWIQCANSPEFCPVMPGDTRIVVIYVNKPKTVIPKNELEERLKNEASYFLHYLMELEIPKTNSRLRIPIVITQEKKEQEASNRSDLEAFIEEHCFHIPGACTQFSVFYEKFIASLPQARKYDWSLQKVGRQFPKKFPKGKFPGTMTVFIGNLSMNNVDDKGQEIKSGIPWIQSIDRIYPETGTINNISKVIKSNVESISRLL